MKVNVEFRYFTLTNSKAKN